MKRYIFPDPTDFHCELQPDSMATAIIGVPDHHPTNGAACQSFEIPPSVPHNNGAALTLSKPGYGAYTFHGILDTLTDGGGGYEVDVFRLPPAVGAIASGPVTGLTVVGDHFEENGRRGIWRMTTGFCDYRVFLTGGDLRSLLRQNQDLGARGRRVFLNIVNIVNFDPDSFGQGFYDRLPEFCALNAEYDQYVELDVLVDSGYRGWSLGKCRDFWARVCDAVRPVPNRVVSLTNEYDHGGNLVGSPNDYPRPEGIVCSQGSAVSDAPPPRPGWSFREFHCAKDYPKVYLFEDILFNGLGVDADGHRWADAKPIVYTEGRRFKEDDPITDEKLARTYAYESLALGEGLTLHTEDGKYSRLLGPRQSRCVKTAMTILAAAA